MQGLGDFKSCLKQNKLPASYQARATYLCKLLCHVERSPEKRPQCFEASSEIIAKDSWQKIVGKDFLLIPFFLTRCLKLPHLGRGSVTIHSRLLFRIAPVSIYHALGDVSYLL